MLVCLLLPELCAGTLTKTTNQEWCVSVNAFLWRRHAGVDAENSDGEGSGYRSG